MSRKNSIYKYYEPVFDKNDMSLVDYERYSCALVKKEIGITVKIHRHEFYRKYEQCYLFFKDDVLINVEGTFGKVKFNETDTVIDTDDVPPRISTMLKRAANAAGESTRVYIRGRRGGLAQYPGYSYWRENYKNIGGIVNVKK